MHMEITMVYATFEVMRSKVIKVIEYMETGFSSDNSRMVSYVNLKFYSVKCIINF